MRFLSNVAAYRKTVRQPVTGLVNGPGGPERTTIREHIQIEFSKQGLTPHERETALTTFTFKGLGEGENPAGRISVFDTDLAAREFGWDDDTKHEIEQVLLEGQNEWYVLYEQPKLPIPWPKYASVKKPVEIAGTVAALGLDPEAVIAYERENENRTEVIEALEALIEDPEPLIAA